LRRLHALLQTLHLLRHLGLDACLDRHLLRIVRADNDAGRFTLRSKIALGSECNNDRHRGDAPENE
jgi:hypothetical protein